MPRRLLPFIFLPLLAACARPTSGPQPLRANIEDLIVSSSEKPPHSAEDHDHHVRELIDLITSSIEPNTWKSAQYPNAPAPTPLSPDGTGTIAYDHKKLVISQSPEIQVEVKSLLQILRQDQGPQVSIECRFILIDKHLLDGLEFNPAAQTTVLDPLTAQLLIRLSQTDLRATALSSPRVTMLSGQTANVGVTAGGGPYTGITPGASPSPTKTPEVEDTHYSVITLPIQATIASNHRSIRLQIADKQLPADLTLSDGQSLLLRGHKLIDMPAASPPSTAPADDRILLILLRPKILLHHEIEVDRFGRSYDAPNTLIPIGVNPTVAPAPPKPAATAPKPLILQYLPPQSAVSARS